MVSNGILPTRDAATHALQLGAFLNPDMPGSLNELIRDVSKRAGHMAGTRAEQEMLPMSERFPGLCWIVLPDNPSITEFSIYPEYWTGTYWSAPDRRRRVLWSPRSLQETEEDRGVLQNLRTGVVGAQWFNAPPGQYLVDASFVMAAAASSALTVSSAYNGTSLKDDYRDDISQERMTKHFHHFIEDHPGGNIEVDISVTIPGAPSTIYTDGSGVRLTYLGRFIQ
jgi:hypothetical protein